MKKNIKVLSMCGAIPCLVCTQAQWDSTYPYFDIEPPWLHADSAEKIRDLSGWYEVS